MSDRDFLIMCAVDALYANGSNDLAAAVRDEIADLRAALAAREPAEKAVADGYKQAATFLWDLLDDIDTAGDMAKGDDKLYRAIVERHQRRRFEVGSTDGHSLELKTDAMLAAAKDGKPS